MFNKNGKIIIKKDEIKSIKIEYKNGITISYEKDENNKVVGFGNKEKDPVG